MRRLGLQAPLSRTETRPSWLEHWETALGALVSVPETLHPFKETR